MLSGALEIIIRPVKGSPSSRMRKRAHEADNASNDRIIKTVALNVANRPKLANIMTSQNISTAIKGTGIRVFDNVRAEHRTAAHPNANSQAPACA